ncbi:uncharacterized protein RJT20DRAFT_133696 [Scheffersomyces xylosifermentans]|uniref:uncharacterized protein n=1 Tax=Scheffersomyces xylosifermentans TaxID=1304137 RepID=UPI00315DB3E4
MAEPPRNILFDDQAPQRVPIVVGNPEIIEDLDGMYDVKTFKILLQTYMGLLLSQYILVYACVPFDDIDNRPTMCIISSLYCLFMFAINATTLPICSSSIPTITAMRALLFSLCLEFGELALSVASGILCLNAPIMYSYEYDNATKSTKKIDVTTYIQVVTTCSMAINTVAFFNVLLLVVMISRALRNLINFIDRRSLNSQERLVKMESELSKEAQLQQKRAFLG